MGDEKIYIRPPDCWLEKVQYGHALQLMKSMYGTRQARQWHMHILTWMEDHSYLAIYSEKTIFMKREGEEWIMHGLLVDDMIHAATNDNLRDQFICEYKADFDITL